MNEIAHIKKNMAYNLVSLMFIGTPFILLLIFFLTGENPFLSIPEWSDEIAYWSQIRNFADVGFSNGYQGIWPEISKIGAFGNHGIGPILLYGLYSLIFGWELNSIVICNALWIVMAFTLVRVIIKPRITVMLSIMLMYLMYLPILKYHATSMTEIPNYAILVITFTFLAAYQKSRKSYWVPIIIFVICFSVLYRQINIVLFIPLAYVYSEYKINKKFFLAAIIFGGTVLLAYSLKSYTAAQYSMGYLSSLSSLESLGEVIASLTKHSIQNIIAFISLKSADGLVQIAQRYLYAGITIWIAILAFMKRKNSESIAKKYDVEPTFIIAAFVAFTSWGIVIGGYDVFDWRDYRSLAPVLWAVVFYCIITNKFEKKHIASILTVLVLSCGVFIATDNFGDFVRPSQALTLSNASVEKVLKSVEYTEDAETPYENTLIYNQFHTDVAYLMPKGIGIPWYMMDVSPMPAKYVLLHNAQLDEEYMVDYEVTAQEGEYILYTKK